MVHGEKVVGFLKKIINVILWSSSVLQIGYTKEIVVSARLRAGLKSNSGEPVIFIEKINLSSLLIILRVRLPMHLLRKCYVHVNASVKQTSQYRVVVTELLRKVCMKLAIGFLIDGQISSYCPDQHGSELLTLIMLHKLTQSL